MVRGGVLGVALVLGAAEAVGAFEFEALDAGSEVSVVESAQAPSARSVTKSLPYLRGGTVGGRLTVQGVYERLGERVYFETRRGAPASDPAVAATQPYEIDVCFRDGAGLPLFASIAADAALIPDCEPARVAETLAQHPELVTGVNRSYVTMKRATRMIDKAGFASLFAPEKRELVQPARAAARQLRRRRPLERTLPTPADGVGGDLPPSEPSPVESGDAGGPAGDGGAGDLAQVQASVWWRHMLGVWTGRAFNITPYDHTATIAYVAYSFDRRFSWALFSWEARNHGRHWYEDGMHHKCTYKSGFDRSSAIWHQQCRTVYNPLSIWGHNCNDDAMLQIWSLKYNRPYNEMSGFPCNDPWTNLGSPFCFPDG
jgi:hypothetical protein